MIRTRLTAVALAFCVASTAQAQTRWVRLDSVAASSEPAAGYWRVAPEGAVFICEPRAGHSGEYRLTLLFSPDLAIAPGTFFGTMTPTAAPGVYEAALLRNPAKFSDREKKRTFTIEMPAPDRMIFKAYHDRLKVNLGRLIPYFYRVSIKRENTRPTDIDGAVRLDGADATAGKIVIL